MFIHKPALLALSALVLAAAPAAAVDAPVNAKGEAQLARLLRGRVAGTPVDCLQLPAIRDTRIVDRTAIVYRVGDTLYVNRPEAGAQSLLPGTILVTDTRISQLCNVDTVRLIDQTSRFPSGVVGLGRFIPYKRAGAAD